MHGSGCRAHRVQHIRLGFAGAEVRWPTPDPLMDAVATLKPFVEQSLLVWFCMHEDFIRGEIVSGRVGAHGGMSELYNRGSMVHHVDA